jgi:hypothetical protein
VVDLSGLDLTKDVDKIKINLAKSNKDAYAELIMSIDTTTMAGMVAYQDSRVPGW